MADSSQQNPLDVLEDILNDAKKGRGKAVAMDGSAGGDASQTPEKTDEQLLQVVQAKGAQQQIQDEEQVKVKLAELKTVAQSSQYQAGIDQKKQAEEQQTDDAAEQEGQDIIQLQHTKI